MELFKLPRTVGQYKNEDVSVNIGRFGPYIKFGELYVNLPRSVDPMTISMEESQKLIDDKLEEDAPLGFYQKLPITKGKGRFGPFVKWNDLFINIPVRFKLETITVVKRLSSSRRSTDTLMSKVDKVFVSSSDRFSTRFLFSSSVKFVLNLYTLISFLYYISYNNG
jgi:topoisomerase IA-like protein